MCGIAGTRKKERMEVISIMKFKKLITAVSTLAMLGSMASAVQVSAADNEKVYPVAGIHTRVKADGYNGNNYSELDVENLSETASEKYEMQWSSGFAAVYQYDLSKYINDKDVTVSVYTDDNAYSVMIYNEMPIKSDKDDAIALYNFVTSNIEKASTGKKIAVDWSDLKNSADESNNIYLVFSRNNNGKWEKNIDKDKTPYLTINSTAPVAKVNDTYYYTFDEACKAVADNSTLTLLQDVTESNRINFTKKNVTVESDNKTISSSVNSATILAKEDIEFKNTTITNTSTGNAVQIEAGAEVTLDGCTVNGKIYQSNGKNCAVILKNTTVNGDILTRKANEPNVTMTNCTITVTDSTVNGSVKYYSTVDDVKSVTNSTITGGVIDVNAPKTVTSAAEKVYTDNNNNTVWKATLNNNTGVALTKAFATAVKNDIEKNSDEIDFTTVAEGIVTIAVVVKNAVVDSVSVTLK